MRIRRRSQTLLCHLKFAVAFFIAMSAFIGCSHAASARLEQETIDQVLASIVKHASLSYTLSQVHGIHVSVQFELDRAGNIVGEPHVHVRGGTANQKKGFATSAKRAVMESAPFKMLPADKYDSWRTVIARFDN